MPNLPPPLYHCGVRSELVRPRIKRQSERNTCYVCLKSAVSVLNVLGCLVALYCRSGSHFLHIRVQARFILGHIQLNVILSKKWNKEIIAVWIETAKNDLLLNFVYMYIHSHQRGKRAKGGGGGGGQVASLGFLYRLRVCLADSSQLRLVI